MAALSSLLTYGNNALAPSVQDSIAAIQEPESREIRKRIEDVEDVPSKTRAKQSEIIKFLKLVDTEKKRTGKGLEECCIVVAANYAEMFAILVKSGKGGRSALTYNNARNWFSLLGKTRDGEWNWNNAAALCDNYTRGIREKKKWFGDLEFWKSFYSLFLNRNGLAIAYAYRLAVMKTKHANPFALIPKLSSVQYRVNQLHPAEVALARHGEEALKTGYICHIDRNWDDILPGTMLVADNRQFDVFVKVRDEKTGEWKAVRPWICAAIDGKSWYLASFIITTDSINNDTIALVLENYIRSNGNRPPLTFYVDNGKDFNAQGFLEPVEFDGHKHSSIMELGIGTVNSIAYNAKAKTVERYFRDVMMEFDKLFPAYLGSRPGERPDTAGYYQDNPEKLPTTEEFTKMFGSWLNHYQGVPKHGKIHRGKSPRDIWEDRIPLAEPLNETRFFMAFLKPHNETRTVQKGPSVRLDNNVYYSEELWPQFGKEVMVKIHRWDDSHVYAFHTDGRFICECRTEESMKALAKDPEDRRKLGEALAKQRRQIKNVYTAVLSLTDGLHVLSPMEQLIAPPDVKIISANERKSVKGASHKFVEYAIAGQESRDAEFAKMLGTEIAVEVEEPRPAIEFREDKKSAETLDFQRKLDATLLRREGGDDKAQIDDFKLEDTGKVEDTNKKEEMSDDYELDKDFR